MTPPDLHFITVEQGLVRPMIGGQPRTLIHTYQRGIPTAFIVDAAGRIAWIGHPLEIDVPLRAVVGGEWDIEAKAAEHVAMVQTEKIREAAAVNRAVQSARDAGDRAAMLEAYEAGFALDPELEHQMGLRKLSLLCALDPVRAIPYAGHLAVTTGGEDSYMLMKIGGLLISEAPANGLDVVGFGVKALVEAGAVIRPPLKCRPARPA